MSHDPSPTAAPSLPALPSSKATPPADARHISKRLPLALAVAAYIASRIYFGFIFGAGTSDIGVYFDYVIQGHDFGETPYSQKGNPSPYFRNFLKLEYPPVGYWVTIVPRLFSADRIPRSPNDLNVDDLEVYDTDRERFLTPDETKVFQYYRLRDEQYYDYADRFRIWMLVFDLGSFGFYCAILRRRRPELLTWGMWGYTLATSFVGYVLFERFDIALTFALLAWAYCWLRAGEPGAKTWAWSAAAYTALGLGISLKLIPVLVVPFALLCDLYALAKPPRRWSLIVGPALLLAAAVLPFAYYYAQVGDDLWAMFRYHSVRGVQIESSYATAMMLLRPANELYCYFDFGSWNLGGTLEEPLLKASTWLLLAALAGLGLRSLAAPKLGEEYDRAASYRMACVVIPVATLLAKVFSVQYLVWAVPLLLLGASERFSRRGFIATVVLIALACAFTGYLYPYHYHDHMKIHPYSEDHPPPWTLFTITEVNRGVLSTELPRTLMILRNLIYGGVCAALYVASMRRTRSSG